MWVRCMCPPAKRAELPPFLAQAATPQAQRTFQPLPVSLSQTRRTLPLNAQQPQGLFSSFANQNVGKDHDHARGPASRSSRPSFASYASSSASGRMNVGNDGSKHTNLHQHAHHVGTPFVASRASNFPAKAPGIVHARRLSKFGPDTIGDSRSSFRYQSLPTATGQ